MQEFMKQSEEEQLIAATFYGPVHHFTEREEFIAKESIVLHQQSEEFMKQSEASPTRATCPTRTYKPHSGLIWALSLYAPFWALCI